MHVNSLVSIKYCVLECQVHVIWWDMVICPITEISCVSCAITLVAEAGDTAYDSCVVSVFFSLIVWQFEEVVK